MATNLIGIDGGGTKTRGRLVRLKRALGAFAPPTPDDFETLAQGQTAATNPHSNPHDAVRERLRDLIRTLCAKGEIELTDVHTVCMGMAGCDRPFERELLTGFVEPITEARVVVVNDALTALAGGLGHLNGIMVIAGTGSIALGARGLQSVARAGGWGHFLGDEGSGFMLGRRALRAIAQAHDGRAPTTALTAAILGHLKLKQPPDLIGWVTERNADKSDIASLSRVVLECAEAGDEVAARIAREEADQLALAADTVRRKHFPDAGRVDLLCGGGNLKHSPYYRGLFSAALGARADAFDLVEARGDACDGAVMIAAMDYHTSSQV